MTLAEAVEIEVARINCEEEGNPREVYNATKLLIEAGKREQYKRSSHPNQSPNLLPGETED